MSTSSAAPRRFAFMPRSASASRPIAPRRAWRFWPPKDPDYLDQVLPKRLPAVAPQTITDPEQLRREIARVRTRGYSINRGGWSAEVGGIAMAVPCNPAYGSAGLCIAVPSYRMTARWIKSSVAALGAASAEIAATLPQSPRLAA